MCIVCVILLLIVYWYVCYDVCCYVGVGVHYVSGVWCIVCDINYVMFFVSQMLVCHT